VTPGPFTLFVGIDWSGAVGPRLPGLRVAICRPDHGPPELVDGPFNGLWSRNTLLDFLVDLTARHQALIGFDFAFTYPFLDRGTYFPGVERQPRSAPALWQLVDRVSHDAEEFYAGPFYRRRDQPFYRYLNAPGHRGDLFESRRRVTEEVCRRWTAPSSAFNGVGPGAVGIGAIAGMRFLRCLRRSLPIWPHDRPEPGQSVVVESFPRLVFKRAGQDPRRWQEPETFSETLSYFGAPPVIPPKTEDEADALVLAACLRSDAVRPELWAPAGLTRRVAHSEGWIFGVF
jgi:hypothetical protein